MSVRSFVVGLMAASMLACAAAPAMAAPPKYLMPPAMRTAQATRNVEIVVGQSEIKSNINQSYVSVAMGGGLLGAIIDAKIEADRAKRAEAAIVPVRDGLVGFDADALALETTKAIMAGSPWLASGDPVFGHDVSLAGKSDALDKLSSDQAVFFEYIYDLSPDFESVRVMVTIQVVNKAMGPSKKPVGRFYPRQLVYSQTLTSVITLPRRGKDVEANAAIWGADQAALTRKALTLGFKDLVGLAPIAFDMTAASAKATTTRDKKFVSVGGVYGRSLKVEGDSELIFSNVGGLARARLLPE